jgi:hypothetical protein
MEMQERLALIDLERARLAFLERGQRDDADLDEAVVVFAPYGRGFGRGMHRGGHRGGRHAHPGRHPGLDGRPGGRPPRPWRIPIR